ncbi:protein MAIN-LIKE 2-like [Cryptomeria japonica]|uniref:protein MAIN-LIKE 2-like n=1 Tax=Cryptomeria japonica TaxID=3369 RepID=UPI0027DA517C|nr:protein MAIN-LIKE 2-like [Cryptomeria japonica]
MVTEEEGRGEVKAFEESWKNLEWAKPLTKASLPDIQFQCTYPPTMRLVRQLAATRRAHIEACGFGHLLQMPNIHVNHELLSALVKRFYSEHNTFHLPTGEMNIPPEDIYKILRIPFSGGRVDYDSSPQVGTTTLHMVFQDDSLILRSISQDDLMSRYGGRFPIACVLARLIGCFVMLDRGQQGFLCGWGRILEMLISQSRRLGWGSCLLAHMYHEMHEIAYQDAKSMAARVLILHIWAWEHIPVCKPMVDDSREAHQPIVC